MTAQTVSVSAPSRLHFGLLRFKDPSARSFGGLGLMVNQPRVEVEVSSASAWACHGPLAQRALQFARLAAETVHPGAARPLAVKVTAAPPEHSGLGVGTQLALSVAAAVHRAWDVPLPDAGRLAAAVCRGKRSAIGSYGFARGGLIFEEGFRSGELLGRLLCVQALPTDWRIVLLRAPDGRGKSGGDEQQAFAQLPPVPQCVTDELMSLAVGQIVPAAQQGEFHSFAEGIYQYGLLAGQCFAAVQGGPFASPAIQRTVEKLRAMGVAGVGQSSWGPTVFALVADSTAALALVEQCQSDPEFRDATMTIAAPNNDGAQIQAAD